MYLSDRVKWWNERASSEEYRGAYDNVFKEIPLKGKRFLDASCGTGEILKRIWPNSNYQLYIGTDATQEMLSISRNNLEDSGIQVNIVSRIGFSTPKRSKKMQLLLDDLTGSRVPLNYADTIVFTFPEVFSEIGEDSVENLIVLEGLMYRELIKRAKIGGTVIFSQYDVRYQDVWKEERTLANKLAVLSSRGLRLKSQRFFESHEIWKDTEGELMEGEIPGYRIFKSVRSS